MSAETVSDILDGQGYHPRWAYGEDAPKPKSAQAAKAGKEEPSSSVEDAGADGPDGGLDKVELGSAGYAVVAPIESIPVARPTAAQNVRRGLRKVLWAVGFVAFWVIVSLVGNMLAQHYASTDILSVIQGWMASAR